jgi:F-type H+-transporting ATPase subunit delta
MANETLARRYATAVFQLATEAKAVTEIGRDLHTFIAALAADTDVNEFFRSPVVDRNEKATVIAQAFDRLNAVALHTVLILIQKRREALAPEIVAQYDVLEREARGAQTLQITTARPLGQAEVAAIVAKLGDAFKAPLDVTQTVDADAIGGVRLTIGDQRIDGTIAGRLDDLARMLSTN